MPWQGLGSGQQHVLLSSCLLEGLERSALDSVGKSVRWAHRRCLEQTSGQGTPNRWHGRGTCWHRRREACSLPERGPRCSWAPLAQTLRLPPPPLPLHLQNGITMVLSSSTRQMGGWNEVTNLKGQPCAQNAPSKALLYYYLKKE